MDQPQSPTEQDQSDIQSPPQIQSPTTHDYVHENPQTFQEPPKPAQETQLSIGQDRLDEDKTIVFTSLPFSATEESFSDFLSKIVVPTRVTLLRRENGSSRGTCICDFTTVDEARKVKDAVDGQIFEGRTIHATFSKARRQPPPLRFRGGARQRPRRNYRDLDAPDDDNEPKRAYDFDLDQEPKKEEQTFSYDRGNRGNYQRRPRRFNRYDHRPPPQMQMPMQQQMPPPQQPQSSGSYQGGVIQDYRTRPNY